MPIFEFACQACDHAFEELIRSSRDAADRLACPACGSRRVERRLSVFAARQRTAEAAPTGGPCGRCGAADGPCGM